MRIANDVVSEVQRSIADKQVPSRDSYEKLVEIAESTKNANAYQSSIVVYVSNMQKYLSSQNVWAAIISLFAEVKSILIGIIILTIEVAGITVSSALRIVPPLRNLLKNVRTLILPPGR